MTAITEYRFFKELAALPFIEAIYLYGSRARGDSHGRSDIDLAIACPEATENDWARIQDIIAVETNDTLLGVDCVRYDRIADADFKARIDRDRKLLFWKNERLEEDWQAALRTLSYALDRFGDVLKVPMDPDFYLRDAAIQRFEFTIELYWKTLKRVLSANAQEIATFPKQAFAAAYRHGWISEESLWQEMIDDRNLLSHAYKEEQAAEVYLRLPAYYNVMRRNHDLLRQRFLKS